MCRIGVLRWTLAPALLPLLLAANALLALGGGWLYAVLLGAQVAFYTAALCGWLLEQIGVRDQIVLYSFILLCDELCCVCRCMAAAAWPAKRRLGQGAKGIVPLIPVHPKNSRSLFMQSQNDRSQNRSDWPGRPWTVLTIVAFAAILLLAGQPLLAADTWPKLTRRFPPTPAPSVTNPADDADTDNGSTSNDSTGAVTPQPGAAASGLTAVVDAPTLNVRQGPATTFPVIGKLTQGMTVTVQARTPPAMVAGSWSRAQQPDQRLGQCGFDRARALGPSKRRCPFPIAP